MRVSRHVVAKLLMVNRMFKRTIKIKCYRLWLHIFWHGHCPSISVYIKVAVYTCILIYSSFSVWAVSGWSLTVYHCNGILNFFLPLSKEWNCVSILEPLLI